MSIRNMGGFRCSYKKCQNISKVGGNGHFFHYPVKNPDICEQWIINSEKPQYRELSYDQLRSRVICENHFEDKCFLNHLKKRILSRAIPTLDADGTSSLMEDDNSQPSGLHSQPSNQHSQQPFDGSANNFESQSCLLNGSSYVASSSSRSIIDLLPTNEDSTVFLLQTYMDSDPSAVSNTIDIETYNIYIDDSLVPSECQQIEKTNTSLVDSGCNAHSLHLSNDDAKSGITSRSPSLERTSSVIMTKEDNSQHYTSRSPVISDCHKNDTSSVKENYSDNTKQSNTKVKTFNNKCLRNIVKI